MSTAFPSSTISRSVSTEGRRPQRDAVNFPATLVDEFPSSICKVLVSKEEKNSTNRTNRTYSVVNAGASETANGTGTLCAAECDNRGGDVVSSEWRGRRKRGVGGRKNPENIKTEFGTKTSVLRCARFVWISVAVRSALTVVQKQKQFRSTG